MQREQIRFWNEFYDLLQKTQISGEQDNISEQQDDISGQLGQSKSSQYKESVFEILHKSKDRLPLTEKELQKIQMDIENQTSKFDEESMFKTAPNLIKILISSDKVSAKDFLRSKLLENNDIELLSEFGHYTIEALIVHVLCLVFNSVEYDSLIRVASLVERLESSVRIQASLLKYRRCKKHSTDDVFQVKSGMDNKKRSKLVMMYPFGSHLVEFMEERGLITLINDLSGSVRVKKKKGCYFLPSHLYAVCNFDISLLPIKLNLPMVCKPLNWASAIPQDEKPRTLSDLSGGYLSNPTVEMYDRYRLLSSGDLNHFYIDIGRGNNYETLCNVMNKLQSQAFQINSDWLRYIIENESLLVEYGYIMPRFLSSLNIKDVSDLLREFYMKDKDIKSLCSFSELLHTLCKNIQRSRYDNFIIKLATAYNGYNFDLPAFLDFRGRIYRSGVLHFHERDLARSLIIFADSQSMEKKDQKKWFELDNIELEKYKKYFTAVAFHYKSFDSVEEARDWIINYIGASDGDIINYSLSHAREAKRPFQFLANIIGIKNNQKI